mmetsp:Transcript_28697/g.83143  ORF Transcript_28697/g.83143 Transcript_28697/m.83143 type:complete len:200 (+) Transcript_28697:1276-1875(+)
MAELRIGKLMDRSRTVHTEVAPDTRRRPEVELLNTTTRRFESGLGVFGSDTNGDAMSKGFHSLCFGEIDLGLRALKAILSIQLTDIGNVTKRDAHGNLQLSSGKIHSSNHLGDGMLHLETRIELEEVEFLVGLRIQVLDSAGVGISDGLGKSHGGLLHGVPDIGRCRDRRAFLNDLLMTTLDRAITAIEGDGIPVLIRQ